MSEESKKPGARDISDLKARLGLKKPGAAPAAGTTPAAGAPVANTPAAAAGGAPAVAKPIPSPFGQPEPAPAAPAQPAAPPDPRRDPFAQAQAANLAAFYGIGQTLPGQADASSAEKVAEKKPWGRIGAFAGGGFAIFMLGSFWGGVSNQRTDFNLTTVQAGGIRTEVEGLSKQLTKIADEINKSKATQQGQPDFEMSDALGGLELKKPDTQKIFHTNYAHFEAASIERLFQYYNHTIELYSAIEEHARKSKNEKPNIESYMTKGATKGEKRYGITVDTTGALPLATFVELGNPVCPSPEQTDCPPAQLKFKYRVDAGGGWGERPVKGPPGQIVTPIQPSALFKNVAAGDPDILAYQAYIRRVVHIKSLAQTLVQEQKELMKDLQKIAERPKLFTF